MKTLVESLFDTDLVSKDICIGDLYKVDAIHIMWGDHYSFYNGPDEDKALIEKMFKPKIKSIKSYNHTDISFNANSNRPDVYEPFLRLLTVISGLSVLPVFDEPGFHKVSYEELLPLLPYMNKANMNIDFYKRVDDRLCFEITKGFGSKDKWIKLTAFFDKKK